MEEAYWVIYERPRSEGCPGPLKSANRPYLHYLCQELALNQDHSAHCASQAIT